MIPDAAVEENVGMTISDEAVEAAVLYSCVTHGYTTRARDELVQHIDNNAGCKMHVEEVRAPW